MNRKLKKYLKITGFSLLALLLALVVFAGISYHLYYSPQAASLPCRGCEGDARAVTVNGFDLYYRELGTQNPGPPIVVVHGGPGQSSQTFKDGFDFLAEDHRVIFYDQRGSGNSQIKTGTGLYTIDLLVGELESLRRDVIRADKIILIGHSAGGALTLRYAMAYPQHVEKMVLVCALSPNGGISVGGPFMDAMLASMNILAGNLPPTDPLQADRQFGEAIVETGAARLYDPGRYDLLQNMGYASFAVNRDITRSTLGGNFDPQLAQLDFPVLVIYGGADASPSTGESMALHFQEVLRHSTLIRMEQSGHWPYLEEPDQFQTVLLAFLTRGK